MSYSQAVYWVNSRSGVVLLMTVMVVRYRACFPLTFIPILTEVFLYAVKGVARSQPTMIHFPEKKLVPAYKTSGEILCGMCSPRLTWTSCYNQFSMPERSKTQDVSNLRMRKLLSLICRTIKTTFPVGRFRILVPAVPRAHVPVFEFLTVGVLVIGDPQASPPESLKIPQKTAPCR